MAFTQEEIEQVREIISQEMISKLVFELDNFGYETMGLKFKVEYDGELLVLAKIQALNTISELEA